MTLLRWLMAALSLALLSAPASAQSFPPLSGQVVDAAHILSPAQIAALTAQSQAIEDASSRQFIVATIPDLQGYPIEDYGYRLGREWKIGQKDANNGIILIIAPNERKVRIEVGYGLEPIMTDALSSQIVRNTILPRFKAGDLPGGIIAGAGEIAEQMKLPLEAGEARAAALAKKAPRARSRSGNGPGDWIVALIVPLVIVFFVLPMIFGRSRGRRYGGDGVASTVGNVILWSALNSLSDSNRHSGWGGGGGSDWGGGGGGGSDWGGGGGGSFGGGGSSGSW